MDWTGVKNTTDLRPAGCSCARHAGALYPLLLVWVTSSQPGSTCCDLAATFTQNWSARTGVEASPRLPTGQLGWRSRIKLPPKASSGPAHSQQHRVLHPPEMPPKAGRLASSKIQYIKLWPPLVYSNTSHNTGDLFLLSIM